MESGRKELRAHVLVQNFLEFASEAVQERQSEGSQVLVGALQVTVGMAKSPGHAEGVCTAGVAVGRLASNNECEK